MRTGLVSCERPYDNIYTYINIHVYTHVYIYMYIYTYTYIYMHTFIETHNAHRFGELREAIRQTNQSPL